MDGCKFISITFSLNNMVKTIKEQLKSLRALSG